MKNNISSAINVSFHFIAYLLISIFISIFIIACNDEPDKHNNAINPKSPLVEVVTATFQENNYTITGNGFIQAVDQINIVSKLSGKIEAVSNNLIAGGEIKKGEMLFKIEQATFNAELKQAKARLNSAKATTKNAKKQLERVNSLINDNLISQEQRDIVDVELSKAKAAQEEAQAALILAKERYNDTVVRAPFNAKIINESISIGAFVSPGLALGSIFNADKVEIEVGLSEQEAGAIKQVFTAKRLRELNNLSYSVTVYAVSTGASSIRDKPFKGYIKSVSPQLDSRSRVINFIVHVPLILDKSPIIDLFLGQYVAVDFPAVSSEKIFSVPQGVVRKERYIFIINDEKLEKINVHVLTRQNNNVFFIVKDNIDITNKTQILLTSLAEEQTGLKVRLSNNAINNKSVVNKVSQ